MREAIASKREERERNAHFSKREKVGFLACLDLGKRGKSHPRLSNTRGNLDLEALELWWSVGEGGEEEAFSSFP